MKEIIYSTWRAFQFFFGGRPMPSRERYEELKKGLDDYRRKSPREHMQEDYRNIAGDMWRALDKYKSTQQ